MATVVPKITTERYRELLDILGWVPEIVSRMSGRSERACRRWGSLVNPNPVPDDMAAWLEDLAAYHLAHPAPPMPQRDPRDVD